MSFLSTQNTFRPLNAILTRRKKEDRHGFVTPGKDTHQSMPPKTVKERRQKKKKGGLKQCHEYW
jgi:hypothetical protein